MNISHPRERNYEPLNITTLTGSVIINDDNKPLGRSASPPSRSLSSSPSLGVGNDGNNDGGRDADAVYEPSSSRSSSSSSSPHPPIQKSFLDYSFKLCTFCGISFYVHYLLPAFFILSFIFWARVFKEDPEHFWYYVELLGLYNLILWETVLMHELGHCLAGLLVGDHTDKIMLWPLGGLTFIKPTSENRCIPFWIRQLIITLGGLATHVLHGIYWGVLLYYEGREIHKYDIYTDRNALHDPYTWKEALFIPVTEYFWYDVYLLGLSLNFWMLVVNLLCPVYPLDSSRVIVHIMRRLMDVRIVAKVYVVMNATIGLLSILTAYLVLQTGSTLQFAGFWTIFEVNNMVQCIRTGREAMHPILME